MCLGTAPVVVASEHTLNAPTMGEIRGILKVDNLSLFDNSLLAIIIMTVNHDIVWLDV